MKPLLAVDDLIVVGFVWTLYIIGISKNGILNLKPSL